jgi:peptide/nickel transport system permease protein
MRFLLRRILHSVLLLVIASVLSFIIVNLAPGDFYDALELRTDVSPGTVSALRSQHGINESLPTRYLRWLRSSIQGDWGPSLAYNSPAGPIVWSRAKNTFLLAGTATLLAWLVALPIGIWSAARSGTWADALSTGGVSILLATPELVLALLLLLVAVRTRYFPAGGMTSIDFSEAGSVGLWVRVEDVARHLFLPSICLASGSLPLLFFHVRTAMKEALQSPFVVAARGYGIPFHRVLLRHALPAAANPLVSLFGLSLGLLASSSLVVEAIFSWPGLGQLLLEAVFNRDLFLVIDAGMLATCCLIFGDLLADVLLCFTDPRTHVE